MQQKMKMKRFSAILLAAVVGVSLAFPVQALAYIPEDQDQTPATEEEIQEAIDSGLIDTDASQFDNGVSTFASKSYAVQTLGGSDRYDTSAREALYGFSKSSVAIVASGAGYADSISAAGLAGALNCPIVLTDPSYVPDVTENALRTLGVTDIVLLGSETVASKNVENQLKTIVGANGSVERVWGKDRYATQMEVYKYGVRNGLWNTDTVVVSSAIDFADALSVSPISFKKKAPVFFIDSSKLLPSAQKAVFESGAFDGYNIILTGSTVVTSAAAEKYLQGIGSTVRLSGSDRYATSEAICNYAVNNLGMTWNGVALASGTAPYDALGGGVIQGKENSVMLLNDEGNPKSAISLPFRSVASMKFFGDNVIFSGAYKTRVAMTLGFKFTDIDDFVLYLDAGHGWGDSGGDWMDPGAQGYGSEYDLNVDLVNRIANVLRNQYGIKVYTNTDGGWYKLRQAEAYELGCGAIVSIHFNAGGGTGTESYIHSYNAATKSDTLQDWIHDDLIEGTSLTDRGQKSDELAILGGNVPATLLEIAFIDNANDMNIYNSRRDTVAACIARGIAEA
ncbi:MAG TPA: cell wall-binding repeat-containing protein [Candidatus Aphodovivens avistercoris]|nr:cell wall-binding repeat-containing protein [Candidatus Aphodovivens avistercoris]